MKVELLSYTPDALNLMLFTKQTRLTQDGVGLDEVRGWPEEKKMEELRYMRGTIQSSWEFVEYVFAISGVSRAFTHQLVRTRTGSYAQQSQRTVDMSGFEFVFPETVKDNVVAHDIVHFLQSQYRGLLEEGWKPEDARSILPTNVATNIVAKFTLRTLSDMAKVRLCFRTQGEYQDVFAEMRDRVIEVHPWAADFIQVHCAATGVCCFPNWMECPIKGPVYNPDTGYSWSPVVPRPHTRAEIQVSWERARSKVSEG